MSMAFMATMIVMVMVMVLEDGPQQHGAPAEAETRGKNAPGFCVKKQGQLYTQSRPTLKPRACGRATPHISTAARIARESSAW